MEHSSYSFRRTEFPMLAMGWLCLLLLLATGSLPAYAFSPSSSATTFPKLSTTQIHSSTLAPPATTTTTTTAVDDRVATAVAEDQQRIEIEKIPGVAGSDEWELDFYSRPVQVINENYDDDDEGDASTKKKTNKLWEILVTDATGSFRFVQTVPSDQVNAKYLRETLQNVMDHSSNTIKPTTVRYFRGTMFNMINVALNQLEGVTGIPSRRTYSIASWLQERHRHVYPQMKGYDSNMVLSLTGPSLLEVRKPFPMPEGMRGERFAFGAIPLSEFLPGGGITKELGAGRLCPIEEKLLLLLQKDPVVVQGIVITTQHADALATWLGGNEMAALTCDVLRGNLLLETDIDIQFLVAKLNDVQRQQGASFENKKAELNGLHFAIVQHPDKEEAAGIWLLRSIPSGI